MKQKSDANKDASKKSMESFSAAFKTEIDDVRGKAFEGDMISNKVGRILREIGDIGRRERL